MLLAFALEDKNWHFHTECILKSDGAIGMFESSLSIWDEEQSSKIFEKVLFWNLDWLPQSILWQCFLNFFLEWIKEPQLCLRSQEKFFADIVLGFFRF